MLTSFILKLAVPEMNDPPTPEQRTKCGIISGKTGIICNLFLVAVKVVLAAISGSIAVAADAVNNLSDAGSGIITIAGFRLSSRPPDAEHPFGHGRTEYVAGLVVALLIMGLGISYLKDSIEALFQVADVDCSTIAIVIFSATILVKCWLFLFYRKVGRMIQSDVIKAAAYDSLSDCVSTAVVVASLIAGRYSDFPLDGCAGIIVAGMILWAGSSVLKDTVSKLLGEPPDAQLVEKIRSLILESPGIDGVHDIMIHNYGANTYYVTAHAEISCDGDRFSAHDILENAEVAVGKVLPVHLLLHGDPYNKKNPEIILWRGRLENTVAEFDSEFKVYDFRLEKDSQGNVSKLIFHMLIPHRYGMSQDEILRELQKKMSAYQQNIELDILFLKSFV